jgi:hypothetical protein
MTLLSRVCRLVYAVSHHFKIVILCLLVAKVKLLTALRRYKLQRFHTFKEYETSRTFPDPFDKYKAMEEQDDASYDTWLAMSNTYAIESFT